MSVYVDSLFNCIKNKNWKYDEACHLFADTTKELHDFALQIGLKRRWFQNQSSVPHYDLTRSKRRLAVRKGAVELDSKQVADFIRQRLGI